MEDLRKFTTVEIVNELKRRIDIGEKETEDAKLAAEIRRNEPTNWYMYVGGDERHTDYELIFKRNETKIKCVTFSSRDDLLAFVWAYFPSLPERN